MKTKAVKAEGSEKRDSNASRSAREALAPNAAYNTPRAPAFAFQDNRPAAVAQRNLQRSIDSSPRQRAQARRLEGLSPSTDSPLQRERREYGYYGRDGKKKSQKVIRMEEFGDRNRIHNLDPNKIGEELDEDIPGMRIGEGDIDKKVGIWRPSKAEGTARPEDPPIYQPFRTAFHETHSIRLALSQSVEDFDTDRAFAKELLRIAGLVKRTSADYKAEVRSLESDQSVADLKKSYFRALDFGIGMLRKLSTDMINEYKSRSEGLKDIPNDDLKSMKSAQGDEVWRTMWWATVQKVNEILGRQWGRHKPRIGQWVSDKHEYLPYMKEEMVGDLDYIGSLAKGYKSAPKQYVRFLPEKFDVDANLDAPPLAVYCIKMGIAVDRGSVKGGGSIPPLQSFEEAAWAELEEVPGIDPDDPFEVFIRASNVTDIMAGIHPDVKVAHREESLSRRRQSVQDRIWALRSKGMTEELKAIGEERLTKKEPSETEVTILEYRLGQLET
jgi:hypothetical protein